MNKRILTVTTIGVGLLTLVFLPFFQGCKGSNSSSSRKLGTQDMNILLITMDTTRADTIGAYGHPTIKTPNIDRLCKQGVMFTRCHTPVPLTLPSHCSIMSGRYPIGHNVRNNGRYFLDEKVTILPEVLKQKGYVNFAAIASFVLMAKFGLNQGFDVYDDTLEKAKMYSSYESEIPANEVYNKFHKWFAKHPAKTQKFFSWLHFYDPHQPYHPPAEYLDEDGENDSKKRYAGEIEFVDKYVGIIISDLQKAGVLENTLVVITGDHGEAFGEHQENGHSIFCYEENLRVPLVFYNEKILPARVVNQAVSLVDVMPTILDILGIKPLSSVQGTSLLPVMEGDEPGEKENDRSFLVESMYGKEEMGWAPLTGVIAGDYKYIALPEPELYNLKTNASETENIYRKQFKVSKAYDKKLKDMILQYSAPASAGGDTSKRDLSQTDLQHLKSLGYVSAGATKGKGDGSTDPKKGILIDNKLKELSVQIRKEENLEEVEKELKNIITETPDLTIPHVYNLLARLYRKQKNVVALLDILHKAIKLYPEHDQFRSNLARILFNSKRYDEALEQCNAIIELNPTFTRAYIMLGDIYFIKDDVQETLKNYKIAVGLEPENIKLQMKYADLLLRSKNTAAALDIYNSLLDKEVIAKDDEFLYKVAMLNTQMNNLVEAEAIFRRIIKIKSNAKYHYFYGLVLFKNKKYTESKSQMEIALREYPGVLSSQQEQQAKSLINALQQNR